MSAGSGWWSWTPVSMIYGPMEPGFKARGAASGGQLLLKFRVDVARFADALPKLFRRYELCAQELAPAPYGKACPANPAIGRHYQNEDLWNRQVADIQASAAIGDIHDGAFNPRATRFQDDERILLK